MEASKVFWKKFYQDTPKNYENNECYFEFLANLIITKFNLDAYKKNSKFTNFFVDDSLRYIDITLRKCPEIWNFFDNDTYRNVISDKIKRRIYLYEVLSHLK